MSISKNLTVFAAIGASSIFTASAASLYVGDAASEGLSVTSGGGPRADTVNELTYILHGPSAVHTAPVAQQLQLTEVNFFSNFGGTLTPFVARYNSGNTQVAASYEILAIGDDIAAAAGLGTKNHAFAVGGSNPVISLDAGDLLVVGWRQVGQIVYLADASTTPDFIANGDALAGASVGGSPTLNSTWAFDRNMRFNIGYEIVPEPSGVMLLGLGALGLLRRRR